jgi:hypothetical protein
VANGNADDAWRGLGLTALWIGLLVNAAAMDWVQHRGVSGWVAYPVAWTTGTALVWMVGKARLTHGR